MRYRVGIDVGGTNTDAVVLDDQFNLLAKEKSHTSRDIEEGIRHSLHRVLQKSKIDRDRISHVMLGTTQCTNAIVERKRLSRVGVIRLGYPATLSVVPYTAWPPDLRDVLSGQFKIVHGGYEFNGNLLSRINEREIKDVLQTWKGHIDAVAVIGVFSSLRNDQEKQVADWVHREMGSHVPVSLSSEIGSLGLIERENATILNSALFSVIQTTARGFENALDAEGIHHAQIYLCQNDGTLMSLSFAKKYPIFTIACGPTNSIRGASYLSKLQNAVVLDVGGTTSDIGVITHGFPRQSSTAVEIGGIRTNFRMPDIISIGLGGGSIVRRTGNSYTIGPDSVGYHITERAKVFGGDILTTTDVAVRLGQSNVGEKRFTSELSLEEAEQIYKKIGDMVAAAIDRMKNSAEDVKVILVGGGGIIVPSKISGVSELIRDENGDVANAIGACISQVSGQYEKIYIYDQINREDAMQDAKDHAINQAIEAGAAEDSIETVDVEEVPLAYYPGNANRIRIKVVGDLA
ncbi:hydantoinase/oxoprolinase family protein [Sporolactobacillus sp. KGMB 08714]|uniref:hydantoinase/oxoprolinase family protein n=1 Tax=Sporolactobacillus sp. KGMB 08714 TaxID=3064704 RepID=UPI002FBDED90